jgi:uncharacterized protein
MAEQPTSGVIANDAADIVKARLRQDLRLSIRAKEWLRVKVLRSLIAALDNAQAVPPGDQHVHYAIRTFGDGSAEVSRLRLSEREVQRLLAQEFASLRTAADELEQLDKRERAAELRAEAAIVESYGFGEPPA